MNVYHKIKIGILLLCLLFLSCTYGMKWGVWYVLGPSNRRTQDEYVVKNYALNEFGIDLNETTSEIGWFANELGEYTPLGEDHITDESDYDKPISYDKVDAIFYDMYTKGSSWSVDWLEPDSSTPLPDPIHPGPKICTISEGHYRIVLWKGNYTFGILYGMWGPGAEICIYKLKDWGFGIRHYMPFWRSNFLFESEWGSSIEVILVKKYGSKKGDIIISSKQKVWWFDYFQGKDKGDIAYNQMVMFYKIGGFWNNEWRIWDREGTPRGLGPETHIPDLYHDINL